MLTRLGNESVPSHHRIITFSFRTSAGGAKKRARKRLLLLISCDGTFRLFLASPLEGSPLIFNSLITGRQKVSVKWIRRAIFGKFVTHLVGPLRSEDCRRLLNVMSLVEVLSYLTIVASTYETLEFFGCFKRKIFLYNLNSPTRLFIIHSTLL